MTTVARPTLDDLGLAPTDRALLAASGIVPEVAAARGYTTVYRRADLEKLGFSPSQRNVPALLIPIYDAIDGGRPVLHQVRPHEPRREPGTGKVIKYETPRGASMVVDVPPLIRPKLGDPTVPLFVTEGARKADSAVSAGLCCVALLGVWSWRGTNDEGGLTALPDWEAIAFNGRLVFIVFDSDVMTKAAVYGALVRLNAFLERKGATVRVIYLPSGPGGAKVGLDDFIAGGKTVDDLLALATSRLREPPAGAPVTGESGAGRPSQATRLVALALESGAELFHDTNGDGYAVVPVADHRETWRLRSKGFRQWLARRCFEQDQKAPGAQGLQDALGVLEGTALFEGPEHRVWTRVAEHNGTLYLDLAGADWRAVAITADGWRIIANPPVRFRRPKGLLPLPEPTRGGSLADLYALVNVLDPEARKLVDAWLIATFRPDRPFPPLFLHGEQGSAKTTAARMLRATVDPNVAAVRSEPRDARDLMIAATNGWVVAFDNLSHISPALSDDLCRLATGGGFGTRTLYENDEETLFDVMRPVIVTGIEELATRADLLDRALLVELPPIDEGARRPEAALWADFDAARPAILGALLDAVSTAIRRLPEVRIDRLPRMADFALWAEAAGPALGWRPGDFLTSYRGNRRAATDLGLESSPVAEALLRLLEAGPWHGTAEELRVRLDGIVPESARRSRSWPRTPRALAGTLRRLAPALRRTGIEVAFERQAGGSRARLITLTPQPNTEEARPEPSQPSRPCPEAPNPSIGHEAPRDGRGTVGEGGGTIVHGDCPAASTRPRDDRDARDGRDGPAPDSFSSERAATARERTRL